ncbi:MAG: hypothetical protein JW995_14985 [Melioribacteraceae bacterium]|nr:hypothetical protein [Melioribacteraceae bacterium]
MKLLLKKIAGCSIIIILFSNSCSGPQIISRYSAGKIIIDGKIEEWQNSLIYNDEENLGFGATNDGNNLYLVFTTASRVNIFKILTMGLTLWIDPADGGKTIGLQYPLQKEIEDQRSIRSFKFGMDDEDEFEIRIKRLIKLQTELKVINENKFPLYAFNTNASEGFEIAVDYTGGRLSYELQIPLQTNTAYKYFVEASPGDELKVSLESGEFRQGRRGGGTVNIPPQTGGMGGVSNPPGGSGGRGMKRENLMDTFDKIEFEINIFLSKSNDFQSGE